MVKVISKGNKHELKRKEFMDIVTQGTWECNTCNSTVRFEREDRVKNELAERAVAFACPVCKVMRDFFRPKDD